MGLRHDGYDVIVIGGGVTGALTLRELSKYSLKLLLLEAGNDLASGATRANSAIIHAGYDPLPGTKKAYFNVRGAEMYPELCEKLDIPYEPIPSLVAAYGGEQAGTVEKLYARGVENGVPELRIISRAELRRVEPNISENAECALFAGSSAIVEPWTVAIAGAENACDNGAEVLLGHSVTAIEKTGDGFTVTAEHKSEKKTFRASCVVNAAGVCADDIHNMVAAPSYKITGKRGQYYVLDKQAAGLVRNILFPCPTEKGKGMLILPEIHGRVLLGPDSEAAEDKTNVRTTRDGLSRVRETVEKYLSVRIPFDLTIRTFSGVRPSSDRGDFIVEECPDVRGFFEAAGIESPGLASSPAIAEYMAGLVATHLGVSRKRTDFRAARRQRFKTPAAAAAGVPGSSNIICRCERVSEAEIIDSIRRNCGARTVKGVKLRTGAGAGGCQGGYCQPEVVAVLARELGIDKSEVLYDGEGSNILAEKTR